MKTLRNLSSTMITSLTQWRCGLVVVLAVAAAGLSHAQQITDLPGALAVYRTQTVTNVFALEGWGGSNVVVSVEGPVTGFATCAVEPATSTAVSRSLSIRGDTAAVGAKVLRIIATESPTSVNVYTSLVNVTVRDLPTVAYASTNNFHNGHIDQDSAAATLTVTHNAAATVLWGKHSNADLFPSTPIFPTGNTFALVPNPVKAGSDTFTIFATDTAGGWTNSISVALEVAPVPYIKNILASVGFDEDTIGTNRFSISYGGDTNQLATTVTFSPANLIQSHAFLSVNGISTNLALVMHPYANANGSCTATVVVSDGTHIQTTTFQINVAPVPDPPSMTGLPAEIFITTKDGWTNVFNSVTFTDPDHEHPVREGLNVHVSDAKLQLVFSASDASTASYSDHTPSEQTTWMRGLQLKAASDLFGVIGSTNAVPVKVVVSGVIDHLTITNTMLIRLFFVNTPPDFVVSVHPDHVQIDESETQAPFILESINDVDSSQMSFTFSLFIAPGYEAYGSLAKNTGDALPPAGGVIGTGNRTDLNQLLRNTSFSAAEGVMTNSQEAVKFIFELSDGFDTTVKTNTITINQLQRPPAIYLGNGAPKNIFITSDVGDSATPYPLVYVTDPDQAGNQPVRASISVSPNMGYIDSVTQWGMVELQRPSDLTALLRTATFNTYPNALKDLAVGQSLVATLTLTAVDKTGLSAFNTDVSIHIERVNSAPELHVPEEQPILFSPGAVIRPFADVTLASDDTNAVTFSFFIDDPNKGEFGNVTVGASGFSAQGTSGYSITTNQISHILNLVTNITFTPSGSYPFPPDDPFGTIFTLTAKDYLNLTTTRALAIQVQDPPRNWLVTKLVNDGTPGTFQHALAHFANNDVITFALPSYPATIRMSAANAVIETGRTLTIKGPGADLLTISGDSDGDGTPNRSILIIASPVTIEGITFSHAIAPAGGAFSVTTNGRLTLRNVVIQDSVATQYGGAIDVLRGRLSVAGCAFLRNTVAASGYGGGAISTFTDYDTCITNTLFDSNAQLSLNGAGGAIFAEFPDDSLDDFAVVDIIHCTFSDNADDSLDYAASSIFAASGTFILIHNSVFADDPATRTLNVDSGAGVWSLGGNICDDSTYVPYQQQGPGGTYSNYLLDSNFDRLSEPDASLAPLDTTTSVIPYRLPMAGSPAIGFAHPSAATVLDQRGFIRVPRAFGRGVAGAIDPVAAVRPAITEIQLSAETGDTDQFIEIFAPRDGQTIDLSGLTLFINATPVHTFGQGVLALTNTVFPAIVPAAGIPSSYRLAPGRGVVVVFSKGESTDFIDYSALNPTPVVRASLVTNAVELAKVLSAQGRGSVAIAASASASEIVRQSFLTVFNDPDTPQGTGRLDTAHNSIVSAPQSRGFAFIPHSSASREMFGGWRGRPLTAHAGDVLVQSPGATVDDTPFGLRNAPPLAVNDTMSGAEDDVSLFVVLSNDQDADGNDSLAVVNLYSGLSGGSGGTDLVGVTDLGATVEVQSDGRVVYDPRSSAILQALPAGGQIVDTFQYEVIDFGTDTVTIIPESNNFAYAYLEIHSPNHRLETNELIAISGASRNDYNGTFAVTAVIDADTFRVAIGQFTQEADYGIWRMIAPRTPSARSSTTVSVTVAGLNDAPTATDDVVTTTVTERGRLRIMAYPDLTTQQTSVVFFDDPVPPPLLAHGESLLPNDADCDAHDAWSALRVYGVVSPSAIHAVTAVSGVSGASAVVCESALHGLLDGVRVLTAGYGGAARYNGWQTITVVDADHFTIPVVYEEIPSGATWAAPMVWVAASAETRLSATTPKGARVTLARRANSTEDNVLYDATVSGFLQTLAEGETIDDRFYYLVEDPVGALGLAQVEVSVVGVNNPPSTHADPDALARLDDVLDGHTLAESLTNRLSILTVCVPADSGLPGRADVIVSDKAAGTPTSDTLIELPDFFVTDEDTARAITAPELLANDTDIDTRDTATAQHRIASVEPLSLRGATVSVDGSGTNVTYNPSGAVLLQALAQGEQTVDLFTVYVTDGFTNIASQVAVMVLGVNDAPSAGDVWLTLTNNVPTIFDPRSHAADIDVHDLLTLVTATNVPNTGGASVSVMVTNIVSGAIDAAIYDALGTGKSFTNTIPFQVTDNSLLVTVDDLFRVPSGVIGRTLDVLANDINLTAGVGVGIAAVTPSLRGAPLAIAADKHALVYSAPTGFAGNDLFSYTVTNGLGVRRTANVKVRVIRHAFNGPFHAADDAYVLARGMTMALPVLDNDNQLPATAAALMLEGVIGGNIPELVQVGNAFVYTATNAAVTNLVFSYGVNGGGPAHATASVSIRIIDRPIKIQDDVYAAEPGAASAVFDVLANDGLLGEALDGMVIYALDTAGTVGDATVGAGGTNVYYRAPPGFRGVDSFRYHVSDRYGATGTGRVRVAVGTLFATADFFQVATNTVTVLDVVANDRARPAARADLTITGLDKIVSNAGGGIGTLQIDLARGATALLFTASTMIGAETYQYVVQDGGTPARCATGLVSIVTVPTGTLNINADRFTVRSGSSGVTLDVLSNDVSYVQGCQPLVIVAVDAVGNHGGTISKVGNDKIQYTPAAGYLGEETFRYYATDAMSAPREAVVTVQVVPGDFLVNADSYVVGYEWDGYAGMAAAVELKLLANDALLPAHGGTFAITSVGIGADAPSMGGTVTLPGGGQSVFFRPGANPTTFAPSNEFTEVFAYEATDTYGRKKAAQVKVRVRLRINEIAIETSDDIFVVERNSTANHLPVLANDLLNPLMPLDSGVLHVATSAQYGILEPEIGTMALRYTPPAGFVGVDTAAYTISDGLGGSGSAVVTILVGALPTADDHFVVTAGSVGNRLNLTSNDAVTSGYAASYMITNVTGMTAGGAVLIDGRNAVRYTPLVGFTGTEQFTYEVTDNSNRRTTGQVIVTVLDPSNSVASATAYLVYTRSAVTTAARQAWDADRFSAGQVTDGDAAGSADPDHDGLSNDAEYVFGGDPNVADAQDFGCIRLCHLAGGAVNVSYTRRANDPSLAFHLYGAADVSGTWARIDALATVSTVPDPLDSERVTATHHVSVPGTIRFFKLVVEL